MMQANQGNYGEPEIRVESELPRLTRLNGADFAPAFLYERVRRPATMRWRLDHDTVGNRTPPARCR
jgi:hypothetical protein